MLKIKDKIYLFIFAPAFVYRHPQRRKVLHNATFCRWKSSVFWRRETDNIIVGMVDENHLYFGDERLITSSTTRWMKIICILGTKN